jgi:ketosteroid isomerase-like protein
MHRMILPLILLIAPACQPAAAPLSEADIAALHRLDTVYADAILTEDADAIAALYAEDAVEMPPNAPANVGREAIRAWYATQVFPAADYDDFSITPGEIDGVNGLAFNRGSYAFTTAPPGSTEPVTATGKYLVIARRQADGSWLWTADIWNADAPQPAAESEHTEGEDR